MTTSKAFYQLERLEIRDLSGNPEISNSILYENNFKSLITGLDLTKLTSLESEAIEDFVNLEILKLPDDMDEGDFEGTVFKNFPKLKELWVGENFEVDSDSLKPLVNLEILHSGDSLISDLSFLPKLRVLFLEESLSTNVNINALTQLEELHLDASGVIDEAYKNLVNLRVLEIDTNYITGRYFSNLINLQELIILSGNIQDEMNATTSLKKLILPQTPPVTTTNKGIQTLVNLEYLSLGEAKSITDSGLAKLTNLIYLDVGYNRKITDKAILKLKKLEYLDVGSANITSASWSKLPNLKYLKIGFVAKGDVEILQKMDLKALYVVNGDTRSFGNIDLWKF